MTSIEDTYKKKSQLEHILLRPDTYIGSIEHVGEQTWVYNAENKCMEERQINYVPGLYKIFDEILVNAADNKQRDKAMTTIEITINQEKNIVSVWNNGKGIPVIMHKEENMYVPTMIFGHLLTSSNYDDDDQKVVGGRNGYGAKLCNIFSTMFTVETASSEYKKVFKQVWSNNMSTASTPTILPYSGEDFTKITFSPDLVKFNMTTLDNDIVALMCRRAYDIAASARGLKVILNNKPIPIKSFKDYIDLYTKVSELESTTPPITYEIINDRWEIGVTISEKGFKQVSFVNSIATTKGGRHVDYVADSIVKQLLELVNKKNKGGIVIKPFQVKNHIWIFINCLIVNPAFDSQTKENMTTQFKKFGSKCEVPDNFIKQFSKSGIVEVILNWAKFKAQNELAKSSGKKQCKIKGVPKLEDANEAGTKNAHKCTLILTEGDSAKCLAVSGLGVIGRDYYGVFPLRGKLLNVREATHKQILENAEINNLIKIIGLQHKKKYKTKDDLKTLRYGKVMIMTDQDPDGSHIKGLIINFVHSFWPELLHLNFLEIFITPIVKVTKKSRELSFYSLPEFLEWKRETADHYTYNVKYYKGLGTSTSKEAKEYFKDMERHRIALHYSGAEDDRHILLAFSKKEIQGRKDWLTQHCEESKRRKELGLTEVYLYMKNTKVVSYTDYVNKELIHFSNGDNIRSIPSAVDGLKPGQRKVLFTCFKRNDKREVKVAQLAGSVAEMSAYHHGEVSLTMTIVNLAQNYVGSNNINLLEPRGQFGTRLNGGKDSASPRYIFTKLSPLARLLFHPHDDFILKYEVDDNQKIEPTWYIPVLPIVLINGSDGIGTGWRSKVPNYNPRDIIENIRRMLNDKEPYIMKPWYKNFKGTIEDCTEQRFVINGEIAIIGTDEVEITELPVGTWTQVYKENVLNPMLEGSEKRKAILHDYREYSTDTTVKFIVKTLPGELENMKKEGLHAAFKLQTVIYNTTMFLFDEYGRIKKYDYAEDILKDFYNVRLRMYEKRKTFLENKLEAELQRLTYQAKFIVEKCSGKITVENKKKKIIIEELQNTGYPPDPVKVWKENMARENNDDTSEEFQDVENVDEEVESTSVSVEAKAAEAENVDVQKYDYLLGMSMWVLTMERKNQLLKQRDDKIVELNMLQGKQPSDLWIDDIDTLHKKLDEIEEKERNEEAEINKKLAVNNKTAGRKKIVIKETMPSPDKKRVIPRLSIHILKAAKIMQKKAIKNETKSTMDSDENDNEPISLMKQKTNDKLSNKRQFQTQPKVELDEYDMMVESNKQSLKSKFKFDEEVKPYKPTRNKNKVEDGLINTKLTSKSSAKAKKITRKKLNTEKKNKIVNDSNSESDNDLKEVVLKRRRKIVNEPIALFESSDELFEKSDSAPCSPVKETSVKENAIIEDSEKEKNLTTFVESGRRVKKRAHIIDSNSDSDMSVILSTAESESSDDSELYHVETNNKRNKRAKKTVSTKKQ